MQALVQAGDEDDDESSDGEWVAASEDDAAVDADDAGQQKYPIFSCLEFWISGIYKAAYVCARPSVSTPASFCLLHRDDDHALDRVCMPGTDATWLLHRFCRVAEGFRWRLADARIELLPSTRRADGAQLRRRCRGATPARRR